MLGRKCDNRLKWRHTAKAVFRAAIGKPMLVRQCVGLVAALAGLIIMTLAWDGPADLVSRPQTAPPKRTSWESDRPSQHAVQTFQRFASNALVLPLIDEVEPARWSRHAIDWICDGRGKVEVNGEPLVDGAPVLDKSTVQWKLERCAPLAGSELLIEGEISFAVSRDDTGLRAHIVGHELTAETPLGYRHRMTVATAQEHHTSDRWLAKAP